MYFGTIEMGVNKVPQPTDLYVSFARQLSALIEGITDKDNALLMAACSGGVDSMTLLHLTNQYCLETGLKVAAAHVNHGVRQLADRDEQFVRNQCDQLGIPCLSRKLTEERAVAPEAKEGLLRERRYEVLFHLVREYGAVGLLVAHHADDQLETVLWRLIRGTSLTGISGMRSSAEREGIPVLRPMLQFSKAQIQNYAVDHRVGYIVDETNQFVDYTRNALRHNVIPHLKEIQPQVLQAVTKFSQIVQEEDVWLETKAKEVVDACVRFEAQTAMIDIVQLHTSPVPLQRRAIKILLYCLASMEWTFEHVDSILQLSNSKTPSAHIQLPSGLGAWKVYDAVFVGADDTQFFSQTGDSGEKLNWTLVDGGSLSFPEASSQSWQFFCECWNTPQPVTVPLTAAVIPAVAKVHIRTADTSERVQPLGMTGSKKLQDVFVDTKVPKQMRHRWPVVCIDDEIIWVPGLLRTQSHLLSARDGVGWKLSVAAPAFQPIAH